MKSFFGSDLLLNSESAKKIYAEVKGLPKIGRASCRERV